MIKHIEVDKYIDTLSEWQEESKTLRRICLDCGLEEVYKWRQPCYSYKAANICILGYIKDFCTLGFFKGVLLKDEKNLLIQQGENTQSARIFKFSGLKEISEHEESIREYIYESIENEKAGKKVSFNDNKNLNYPEEVIEVLAKDPELNTAFENLTPGRKRAYIMFINSAKQSTTKTARLNKYRERIFAGKGMNDCICGHSKRMPNCDGSHKFYK